MKQLIKTLLKQPWMIRMIAWIAASYIRLVFRTNRWKFINRETFAAYLDNEKPFIGCFWHGRLAMMTCASWGGQTPHMLISTHADGLLVAETIRHLGVETISGSASKGGAKAVRNILKKLQEGHFVGVTPDGPRGPRFQVNPNIIQIARIANVDIIPGSFSTTRRRVFKSWDRFVFPLPFGRGVFTIGTPVTAAELQDKNKTQEMANLLQDRLNEASCQADALSGHAPMEDQLVRIGQSTAEKETLKAEAGTQ